MKAKNEYQLPTLTQLANATAEHRGVPLLELGKSIQEAYRIIDPYPQELVAEAYLDYKHRDDYSIDTVRNINGKTVEKEFLKYLENFLLEENQYSAPRATGSR